MQIQEKAVDELLPYEKNPRLNDDAVTAVANSIKQFGFNVPIIIDATGGVVAGHTRLKAAKQLGMATVPCIVKDDLTPEALRAYRIVENKTGELAKWDFALLGGELEALVGTGIDMTDFGWDQSSLDALIGSLKSDTLDKTDVCGDDDRLGRFILVYASEAEKEFWMKKLGCDGSKVVYCPGDFDAA